MQAALQFGRMPLALGLVSHHENLMFLRVHLCPRRQVERNGVETDNTDLEEKGVRVQQLEGVRAERPCGCNEASD